ncbi:MAG: tyrosine-type recombinase/integrase [Prochloraceae cyanobacterium]|nr:tyrosine-type recombinase/integrase [Prochloraceae cyanobacterium]
MTAVDYSLENNKLATARRFSQLLSEEIANGRASEDTVKSYTQQFKLFVHWCSSKRLEIAQATEEHIKEYRRYLVNKKLKVTTIALKLTVVRRVFEVAVERGLMALNPAAKVKPPKERIDPAERNNYLELEEASKLVDTLPKDNSLVGLRDRLLVLLMLVCGCRQIGLYRLNVGDIIRRQNKVGLRVREKGSIRVIPLRTDVAELLERYLRVRKATGERLTKDTPMFVSVSRNSKGKRLTRRSMQLIVNKCLEDAALKYSESRTLTTHGLRHTVGYLLTQVGKPLRVIQDFLGHADPRTTAIYAHIVNLWTDNPTKDLAIVI